DGRSVGRNPLSVPLDGVETHQSSCAATDWCCTVDEAVAVDVQTLVVAGEDEPVVLGFVEPEHRPVHSRAFFGPVCAIRPQLSNESSNRCASTRRWSTSPLHASSVRCSTRSRGGS